MDGPADAVSSALRRGGFWLRAQRVVAASGWALALCVLGLAAERVGASIVGPLVAVAAIALVAAFGWPAPARLVAARLDARFGLADRLTTALAFAGSDAPLVGAQRAEAAAAAADIEPRTAFPLGFDPRAPLVAALLFGVAVLWARREPSPPSPEPGPDVLAAIEAEREIAARVPDRRAVQALDALEQKVRAIRAAQRAQRAKVPPEPVATSAPPPKPVAPPSEPPPRITAADLVALEQQALAGMALSGEEQADMVSHLFAETRAAAELAEAVHELLEGEHEAAEHSSTASAFGASDRQQSAMDRTLSRDLGSASAVAQRSAPVEDEAKKNLDVVRRDLGAEAQAAHDAAHDLQRAFDQFLRDFVKEVQTAAARAAAGRHEDARQVSVADRERPTADPSRRMAAAGFEEAGTQKRSRGDAPPEPPSGMSQDGGPPDGAMRAGAGRGEAQAMATSSSGPTSAGAEGAGTGTPGDGAGTTRDLPALAGGALDSVLGSVGQGRMPEEQRERLFDRIAEHSVEGGLASERDDALTDYFADADEQIAASDSELTPLLSDYASAYFDAIRPGGVRDGR
jgi:hypothetical protein